MKCVQYYHNMELNSDCLKASPYCGAPIECIRHDAVFNMLNFLTTTTFLPPNVSMYGCYFVHLTFLFPFSDDRGMD